MIPGMTVVGPQHINIINSSTAVVVNIDSVGFNLTVRKMRDARVHLTTGVVAANSTERLSFLVREVPAVQL